MLYFYYILYSIYLLSICLQQSKSSFYVNSTPALLYLEGVVLRFSSLINILKLFVLHVTATF